MEPAMLDAPIKSVAKRTANTDRIAKKAKYAARNQRAMMSGFMAAERRLCHFELFNFHLAVRHNQSYNDVAVNYYRKFRY